MGDNLETIRRQSGDNYTRRTSGQFVQIQGGASHPVFVLGVTYPPDMNPAGYVPDCGHALGVPGPEITSGCAREQGEISCRWERFLSLLQHPPWRAELHAGDSRLSRGKSCCGRGGRGRRRLGRLLCCGRGGRGRRGLQDLEGDAALMPRRRVIARAGELASRRSPAAVVVVVCLPTD